MKIWVTATVNDNKLTWPSEDYIYKYRKFGIECEIIDEDFGLFKDKYKLKLKGTKEDLEEYLSYLLRKGFEIKNTTKRYTL